ncbi:MAG TPA: MtrB/PioB family outer membrane beta-barrel protein [Candidatus Sulfomarinibacteraceae bacterium]|nr:MtrB/PioB family outer membrane beta-barrel protein [Candidatus Sulfomarinibacteraceae bacterium]
MNTHRIAIAAFACILATLGPLAFAQSTSFDIEVGYQSVDVEGNEDMFRTQVNQDDGVVLGGFTLNFVDPSGGAGFVDHLRVDASGFGGNPAGRFRLDMGLGMAYRLSIFYQEMNAFSALPAYANPLLDSGVVPGQHTWDRDRDVLDIRLELLPGRTVTPIIGYRWNRYEGPGLNTYSVGNDEFRIASDLEETETEFYVGLAFATNRIQGTVLQGWREFSGEYRDTLAPGEGVGNDPGTTIGREITLDTFDRSTRTEADTPVTTVHLTGKLNERARLVGSYVRADADSDTRMSEMLSGSLASFQISRFFAGLDESVESRTENPYWRGELRLDWDLSRHVGLKVGYEARERELEGWTIISSLYSETLNFGGFDPRDISTLVEAETGYEREESIVTARLDARDLGPVSLWAEYAVNDQDLDVSADVAQIILPGGQEGEFNRQIDSYNVGGSVHFGGFKLLLDVLGQDADDIVMRTDFSDRMRLRARVDWSMSRILRLLLTAESMEFDNNDTLVGYEGDTDRYAVDLTLTPTENFMIRGSWDTYTTDTEIPIRAPQSFETFPSIYAEDGEMLEGALMWKVAFLTLDAAYSTFDNTGSFPFQLDRAFARVAFDLSKAFSIAGEYENWDYSEDSFPIADYDAERWGVFVRWRQ